MTLSEQLREFCRIDAERARKRVEAAEMREWQELSELSKMAAGEAVRLTCQCDNISRSPQTYKVKNKAYYDKTAVALERNVNAWILSLGRRYLPAQVEFTEELAEKVAREHVAEFTITIPHFKGEDLAVARRRFTRAFNDFNRRFLKEKAAEYFGEFVRVFEPHKDGVLHAHILIECKKSLKRGSMPFKWRTFKGASFVRGETVAPWVSKIWTSFRNEELASLGIGKIHTLQPIRKGIRCFSKYVAKYICKNLGARPEYMRGLRVIAYSRDFLDGTRLKVYDYDRSERIPYFSKKKQCVEYRYKRFSAFSINCPSTRARGQKLNQFLRYLGTDLDIVRAELGFRWAFYLQPFLRSWQPSRTWYKKASKFERFAALRGLLGDAFKCVVKFKCDNLLYRFEDFKKVPSAEKARYDFSVVGFLDSGVFIPLKRALRAVFGNALREAEKLRYQFRNRSEFVERREELYAERRRAYFDFENGKLSTDNFHSYLKGFQARLESLCLGVKRWTYLKTFSGAIQNLRSEIKQTLTYKPLELCLQ